MAINYKYIHLVWIVISLSTIALTLPVMEDYRLSRSGSTASQSQVSFTLFKRVSHKEWEDWLADRNSGYDRHFLLLVKDRPGVIPISHYSYQIQYPIRKILAPAKKPNRIHLSDRNKINFPSQIKLQNPGSEFQTPKPNYESTIIFPDSKRVPTRSTPMRPIITSTTQNPGSTSTPVANPEETTESEEIPFADEFIKWANSVSESDAKTSTPESILDVEEEDSDFSLIGSGSLNRKCKPGQRVGPNGVCRKQFGR